MSLELLAKDGTTLLALAILINLAINMRTIPRLQRRPVHSSYNAVPASMVSILVPARNEAQRIAACLDALLTQTHKHREIIVLDDESEDDTAAIVARYSGHGVRLLRGKPLPDGWTGKTWACSQLAEQARGEVLCFVDADTLLAPSAIAGALEIVDEINGGLVTLLLSSDRNRLAQATFLPVINYALMALLPVWLMHREPHKGRSHMAVGIGPFMMLSTAVYSRCGGHSAIRSNPVDDVALARAVKRTGSRVRLANGTAVSRTHWYSSTAEIWRGFSKNLFGALESNLLAAAAIVLILVPLLCWPFAIVLLGVTGLSSYPIQALVWLQAALILLPRLVTSIAGRDPLWTIVLHPVAIAMWGANLVWSATLSLSGHSIQWRGRTVKLRQP
jgi:chlorobactene glucosyltransferase